VKAFSRIHSSLFYLLIAIFPIQLGFHFWPSWAMVLGRRIDYLSPTLYATDILIGLLLFSWFTEKVSGDWYLVFRKRKINIFTQILNTKTLILCIFVITNILVAASRPVAIYTWLKCVEFFLLGLYIVNTKPKFERIVFFLSISILYSSCIAIVQFILQHSLGDIFWLLGERTFSSSTPGIAQIPLCLPWAVNCPLLLRAYGTFPHPNVLGGFLATMIPFVIYKSTNIQIYKLKKQIFLRWFYGITIIFGIVALILTFSRSAWVAGVLGVGIACLVSWNSYLVSRVLNQIRNTRTQILFPLLL
jgi:hypothetical protein